MRMMEHVLYTMKTNDPLKLCSKVLRIIPWLLILPVYFSVFLQLLRCRSESGVEQQPHGSLVSRMIVVKENATFLRKHNIAWAKQEWNHILHHLIQLELEYLPSSNEHQEEMQLDEGKDDCHLKF
jgi:hypothetical protein